MSTELSREEMREFEEQELDRKKHVEAAYTLHGVPLNRRHNLSFREKIRLQLGRSSISPKRNFQAITDEEVDSEPSRLGFVDTAFLGKSSSEDEEEIRDGLTKERIQSYLKDDSNSKFAQSLAAAAAAASFNGRRVLDKQFWEQVKPVIQRLYIEEERSFSFIVDVLSRSYNVYLTEIQIRTQIKIWGMWRKERGDANNITQKEVVTATDMTDENHERQKDTDQAKGIDLGLASLPDDISEGSIDTDTFSSISDGETSQTSMSETLGASKEFSELLLRHEGLMPLFNKAHDRLDGESFKKEFKYLLKAFSSDLAKEARKVTETAIAHMVRHSRRRVTINIWRKVYGDNLSISLAGFIDQTRLSKKRVLEEALRRMNSHEERQTLSNDDQTTEIQVEDDSSDEDDFDKLVNLQQAKKFLIDSHAFGTFLSRLKLLVEPREEEKVCTSETSDANEIELTRHETTRILAFNKLGSWLMRRWHKISDLIDRGFRPSVPHGYRRLEWTCNCGTTLYGDFENSDTGQFDQLQRDLTEDISPAGQDQEGFSEHNPGHTSDSNAIHTYGSSYPSPSGSRAPLRRLPGLDTFATTNTGAPTSSFMPLSAHRRPELTATTQEYFAICVSAGEYLTILSEIEVSSIMWDRDFFGKMWEEYHTLRGFRSRYIRSFLIKPVDVKYVKFTVDYGTQHQRAVILSDPPDFPDQLEVDEGRYEYTPCPLTFSRPRPTAAVFLHYLQRPDCPTRKWFSRLPKKLSPAVLHNYRSSQASEDVIGWGVQIIEGPNKKAISWMCLILLGLSAIVSILYAQVRSDASSGFAIGAYLLTGGALVLSAFYFQWREQ